MPSGDAIPLHGNNYLDDLMERVKKATEDFSRDAEIRIPFGEAMEFDIENKVAALIFKTGAPIICTWNDDGSATLSVVIS